MIKKTTSIAIFLTLLGLFFCSVPALATPPDAEARVDEIFEEASQVPIDHAWDYAVELEDLGREHASLIDTMAEALDDADNPNGRLLAAKALLELRSERRKALEALVDLIKRDGDRQVRVRAANLLEIHAGRRRDVEPLKELLPKIFDPFVKIAVAKTLRAKARDIDAGDILKEYLESDTWSVAAEAALALGELGNVEVAKPILDRLKEEPTERGKRARVLLIQEKLYQSLKKSVGLDANQRIRLLEKQKKKLEGEVERLKRKLASGGSLGNDLLDELKRNIKHYYDYVEKEEIDDKKLIDAAAKGMVGSLDPYSSYMTEKETDAFEESISGEYAGIGAVVQMDPKDKLLTIIRPIYSGPAYEAGLRSLDKVTEVEGESTYGKTVQELVSKLKGEPDTPVTIKVWRKGWKEERPFTLVRKTITLKSVHYGMMPGKLGYVSLSQFGEHAVEEVEEALKKLEKDGMQGLIFDLRNNPGGLLSAAVQIADKFLKDDKLIVYSKGRNPYIAPRREFRTQDDATHPDFPVVVLINGASASASEIVSGALQDHKRATLVGTTSFGKGSVQQLMKVRATGGESTLRLTIARYYLPSGRSIHEKGIDPEIAVEVPEIPGWIDEAMAELRGTPVVDEYVRKHYKKNPDLFAELAHYDGEDASRYPGFAEWYEKLDTKLPEEWVRRLVRNQARRYVQDARARQFAFDLMEDHQLQRAVLAIFEKLGADPDTYEEYSDYREKFAAQATEEGDK